MIENVRLNLLQWNLSFCLVDIKGRSDGQLINTYRRSLPLLKKFSFWSMTILDSKGNWYIYILCFVMKVLYDSQSMGVWSLWYLSVNDAHDDVTSALRTPTETWGQYSQWLTFTCLPMETFLKVISSLSFYNCAS